MLKELSKLVYRAVCAIVRLFYRRPSIEGVENLPDRPCILVGNHAQMNGPIVAELYLPFPRAIWCAGEMMNLHEVADYAYRDFWSQKPKATRWLFRLVAHIIPPLSVSVFNNAHCIGVYRDQRIVSTIRTTLEHMKRGERIVIFPEHDAPHNHIVYDFQNRFIDVARMYHRQTGVAPSFVPIYFAPKLHRVVIGAPIPFDPQAPQADERSRLCAALMDAVTALAEQLPPHTVVPYRNIPKRLYPKNLPDEVTRS